MGCEMEETTEMLSVPMRFLEEFDYVMLSYTA